MVGRDSAVAGCSGNPDEAEGTASGANPGGKEQAQVHYRAGR